MPPSLPDPLGTVSSAVAPSSAHARVLDAGGWFVPFSSATHVVDLMPYATRRGRLALTAEPGERFTRDTWTQVDFLNADLRLPYTDGFFDFAYCGHTLEDLLDPAPLLCELARVARAGRIVSPSRLAEQTVGIRDRASRQPGHPHHHWIIDPGPDGLEFSRKVASLADRNHFIPLSVYERRTRTAPAQTQLDWSWNGPIRWRFCDDATAIARARATVAALGVSPFTRWRDAGIRAARRLRDRLVRRAGDHTAEWWQQMLALSRPYSRIPL